MPDNNNFSKGLIATRLLAESLVKAMSCFPSEPDSETAAYQGVVHFFFCKAYKSYQAFALLCECGFVEDAEILSRTIFEVWMQAQYMSTDPRELVRKFAEYDRVRRYLQYWRLKLVDSDRARVIVSKLESDSSFPGLKQQYDRMSGQFLKTNRKKGDSPEDFASNWWGGSIRWLAKQTQVDDIYVSVYGAQSDLVHSSSGSMDEYVTKTEDEWLAKCYPDGNHSDLPTTVRWASIFFLGISKQVNDAWKLGLEQEIGATLSEIEKITVSS